MLNGEVVSLRELEIGDLDQLFVWNERRELYLFKGRYKFVTKEDLKTGFKQYLYSQKIFIINKGIIPIGITSYWDENYKNRSCEIYAKIYKENIESLPCLTDCLNSLITFLFQTENYSKVYAHLSDPFDQIRDVLKDLGFNNEGTLREHKFINGQYKDTVVYGKLKNNREY